jgi:hypothetical protein
MAGRPAPAPRSRTAAAAIALAVALGHVVLVALWPDAPPAGRGTSAAPAPLEVRFVHVLQPRAPWLGGGEPTAVPPPAPVAAPRAPWITPPDVIVAAAARPASEASSSAAAETVVDLEGAQRIVVGPSLPPASSASAGRGDGPIAPAAGSLSPTGAAPAAVASPGTSPEAPPFEWPPSTRLRYALKGDYLGPVEGSAEVRWIRVGDRYEVHLDVVIGPSFAPAIARRMRSAGHVGSDGLVPEHFEQHTRLFFGATRSAVIELGERRVRLPSGRTVPRPPGVQDAVSQFVQLTWRFLRDPALLRAGQRVVVPLALPARVEPWVYEVREAERLETPAGPVPTVHVRPRREARAGGDLVPEMWFAPSLQSLPVRILIRQDEDTYVDLRIDRLPEQAEPASGPEATIAR